jgi:hypothetical protein
MKTRLIVPLGLLSSLTCSVFAIDRNPYNPQNWLVMPTEGTHIETGVSWSLNSAVVPVRTEYSYSFVPPQPNSQPQLFCTNTSGWNLDSEQKSTASVTVVWEWIGEGTAPESVWVRKFASAMARVAPDGTLNVDNGLGHPLQVVNDSDGSKRATSTGVKWQNVSLSGKFLRVDFYMSASAVGHSPVSNYFNKSVATLSYGISLKAAPISTNRGQTYRRKSGTWDKEVVPRGESHVAFYATPMTSPPGTHVFGLNIEFLRSLYGVWGDPYHEWTDGTETWVDTWLNEKTFVNKTLLPTSSEVESIAAGSPKDYTMNLQVTDLGDGDQGPYNDSHKLKIFAPLMKNTKFHTSVAESIRSDALEVGAPGYAIGGAGVPVQYEKRDVIWDIYGWLTGGADVVTEFVKMPWLKAIVLSAGYGVNQLAPENIPWHSFPWVWGSTGSTYDGLYVQPFPAPSMNDWWNTFNTWFMIPRQKSSYKFEIFEGERYVDNGYSGRATSAAEKYYAIYRMGDFFSSVPSGGTGGGGGNVGGSS